MPFEPFLPKSTYVLRVASELKILPRQVESTGVLLAEGSTVPFIARYRKEVTGSLDEVAITSIRDRLIQLYELDKRRATILESIHLQGKLTQELKERIENVETLAVLEDLYLPFKPKRRTRATAAREKGLEPLARKIFDQSDFDVLKEAEKYVEAEKKVASAIDALAGARDIIAEWINEDAGARHKIRAFYLSGGYFKTTVMRGKETEGIKYKDYYDWQEPVKSAPSHRILAMRRGEKEEFLSLRILVSENEAFAILENQIVKSQNAAGGQVKTALEDSFKRLLSLSMETEIRLETKERADEKAISVFAENLRQLLMAPPLGQKNVLAIDPGFRTGCKAVCLNKQGKLLFNTVLYISQSEGEMRQAGQTIKDLCKKYTIECIAIGSGTAGRETESFIRALDIPENIQTVVVNESGASIYSASDAAREEFPDDDITVRGAVSIGRRLMDPLAELVKIDPKSIGVGQYQHDVDQIKLKNTLDDVVISCVNTVGVEVNTASKELLMYVSGLGPVLAKSIVDYRGQNGPFLLREDFKQVPRFGSKVFEQAAGFLRIQNAKNPLDASAVHPESYEVVEKIISDLNCSMGDLIKDEKLRRRIDLAKYVNEKIGLPTLTDIVNELARPGRDPRQKFETFQFDDAVHKMEDLKPGMKLPGIVTNVAAFGVFVDVGVHQDGLIHISELANHYVKDPNDVVKVHQKVVVTILEIDIPRRRISLSMKSKPNHSKSNPPGKNDPGKVLPQQRSSQAPARISPFDNIKLS